MARRYFRLDEACASRPTEYEIDLVVQGVRHRYGFKIENRRVISEWAFRYPKGKPARLFVREENDVESGVDRGQSRAVTQLLRPNALYLSTAAAANYEALLPLYSWFQDNLALAEASNRGARTLLTAELFADSEIKEQALSLMHAADLGVVDIRKQLPDPQTIQFAKKFITALRNFDEAFHDLDEKSIDQMDENALAAVQLMHRGERGPVLFDIAEESLGTVVWLGLVGPIIRALRNGTVLLADELDASLHPLLVEQIIRLFQDPATNPFGAQLLFNSFDPGLLGNSVGDRVLGRDQVWFTEKLFDGASRLYPLTEFSPRTEESIANRYRAGRYGGIPIVSHQDFAAAAEMVHSASDE